MYITNIHLSLYIIGSKFNIPTQHYETIARRSMFQAFVESLCSIVNHFLCSQIHRQQNAIYFIFSLMAVIWLNYAVSSERFLPNDLVNWVINNVCFAWTNGFKNDVTERSTNTFRHKNTAMLVQTLTVSHNRALPHWYRHWQYHTRCTALLVQALTISHNRTQPHWNRHW
jgi:hypothetical protein